MTNIANGRRKEDLGWWGGGGGGRYGGRGRGEGQGGDLGEWEEEWGVMCVGRVWGGNKSTRKTKKKEKHNRGASVRIEQTGAQRS